ncbi:MAG: hypothetical protein AAFZ52_13875 [Bacteroidota bacterium]
MLFRLICCILALVPFQLAAESITTVEHLGRPHFRITTRMATYLYDPVAGGFSSILDREGKDWVSYKDKPWGEYPASAASSYRGVPNLVFRGDDDGAGHPGHKKCESRVVAENKIHTVSLSGDWAWTWTFYKDCARLDVEKAPDDRPYWFLYEGPVGGSYQPRTTFWATDLDAPSYVINDHYQGKVQRGQFRYMFFGENQRPHIFFMLQLTPDTRGDHISYLGNKEIGAANSPDGMVVAGFGRAEGAKPLLTGTNSFLIGFQRYTANEKMRLGRARRKIERLGRTR